MKMFWFSAILLLAALIGVSVNYIYINEVCDTLIEQIETLPDVNDDNCLASAKHIADYWNEHSTQSLPVWWICFSSTSRA